MRNESRMRTLCAFVFSLIASLILISGQDIIFSSAIYAAPVADTGSDQTGIKTSLLAGEVVLEGSVSSDNPDDTFDFEWYGPFGVATGVSPFVQMPQGTYTVSLQAVGCPESSDIATAEITISPAFTIAPRSKTGKVQLTWTHIDGTDHYDVYRADESDPFSFEKIVQTTSTYSTYLDYDVVNETNYLYAVSAINDNGGVAFSNIVASCPPASRRTARSNRPPMIYSPAVTTGNAGFLYAYTVLAADANSDTLTYSLVESPSGMVIDGAAGRLQWTPVSVGIVQVTVNVSDGNGLEDTQRFSIDVTARVPAVKLIASPESIGSGGDISALSWCATHAEYCIIEPAIGEVDPFGNVEVSPDATTEYTISAFGPGGEDTDSVTISVVDIPPPTVSLSTIPSTVEQGGTATLKWISSEAQNVSIDNNVGDVALNSNEEPGYGKTVSPEVDTVYTITATGPGGTATDSASVTVIPSPPMVDIFVDNEMISLGQPVQLFWNSTNAASVEVDQGIGGVALSSRESDEDIITYPQNRTTYTITATGPGGTSTDSVTVRVDALQPPNVDIVAAAEQVAQGGNTWLYWNSTNAETVTIDREIGTVPPNGCYGGEDDGYPGVVSGECSEGRPVTLQSTTTYTITATGPGGTASDSVTVTVTDALPPSVNITAVPDGMKVGETAWLYWHSSNADTVVIDQGIGTVAANGCYGGEDDGFWEDADEGCGPGKMVSPTSTTTYTITATGPGGTATNHIKIIVYEPPPPTVEIIADPDAIEPGLQSRLYWHSTNAELVSIDQDIGVVAVNGCLVDDGEWECEEWVSVSPSIATTYTITAIGPGGIATDSATVTVSPVPPPTVEIIAWREAIESSESNYLFWHSTNAEVVSINQEIGVVGANGCYGFGGDLNGFPLEGEECGDGVLVWPEITTMYTITATGSGGTATDTVTVYVDEEPPPTVEIIAWREVIEPGENNYLFWHSTNAEVVSINQEIGVVGANGCYGFGGDLNGFPLEGEECGDGVLVSPVSITTYTITATGTGGTTTDSVTITVDDGSVPTADFNAEPASIFRGQSTTLRWHTNNAHTVSIDQEIGEVALNSGADGFVVSPEATTTYTLTAVGDGGQGQISITVIVLEPLPPLVDLTAWPETVRLGEAATLAWSSASAATVIIENDIGPDIGQVALNSGDNGIAAIPPSTTTYTIIATGPGGTATDSVMINVLPLIEVNACELPLIAGESCVLTINTVNGETVSINQGVGDVPMIAGEEYIFSGSVTVMPLEKTTYIIMATGSGGTSTETITIDVAPEIDFHVDTEIIEIGTEAHLHWTTYQANKVFLSPDIGEVTLNSDIGGLSVSPTEATTYVLKAEGATRSSSSSVRIYVNDFSKPPTVTLFRSDPPVIDPGQTTRLEWETANLQEAYIDNGIGDVPMSGSIEVSPQRTTTYTLVVRGPQGLDAGQVTVRVRGTQEAGSFGDRYLETVPDGGMDLEDDRFSILTGYCKDPGGNPIAGVEVSILGKPEFGEVLTDDQGRFSLPVKGNNRYTVVMAGEGLFPVHRKTEVLNNRIAVVDTVALIAPDSIATLIDFTADPEPVLFHAGTFLADDRGGRQLSMTIPSSDAFDGPKTIMTTEYFSHDSLPAPLPPNTPYTYAVEIGSDDGIAFSFDEPAVAWVNNFLGFPVGQTIPVGWYDSNEGQWVPSENGMVVILLDADLDDIVDGLDIDGDQQADDLDGDGEYADEVIGLPPGSLQAGAAYYRFMVDRTGSWALSFPYAALDAPAPEPDASYYDLETCLTDECEFVQQDIAIPGTEFYLHYSEARVSAYQPVVTIPATGDTVPPHAEAVVVRMTVAGRVYEEVLSVDPGQTVQFQWDGKDYLGKEVVNPVTAEIAIGYVYDRNYAPAGDFIHAFSQASAGDTTVATREKYISWRRDRIHIDRFTESEDFIAEGWTLSAHHQTIESGPATLYHGNGDLLSHNDRLAANYILFGGIDGFGLFNYGTYSYYPGKFGLLSGIAVDDDRQEVYWSNTGFDVIWKFDADYKYVLTDEGIPERFVGAHYTKDPAYDHWPAEYRLNDPKGIAIDGADIYYAESSNHAVRKGVFGGERYMAFAGTGDEGYSGNGQSALDASFYVPDQLAVDHWGNLYIIDQENSVIRRVSADGIVETVAGNGMNGSDGDNGPALAASISPSDIAIDAFGNIFIAEPDFYRVRKIDLSGIITTVAGTGTQGASGLGGPAASAELLKPEYIAVNTLGNLFIGDGDRLLEIDDKNILRKVTSHSESGSYLTYSDIGVMTTDMQDRLFLNDPANHSVYRIGAPTFEDIADEAYYSFVDAEGLHHSFSALGKHLSTFRVTPQRGSRYCYAGPFGIYRDDDDTVTPIYAFVYNLDNLLVGVKGANGETILTINRDDGGKVLSFESGEGITSLNIDADNQLVGLETPDAGSASMTYNDQGFLTGFTASFTGSLRGKVTDSTSGALLSGVTVTLTTNQGTLSGQTDVDGNYLFSDIEPGGYTLEFKRSDLFNQAVEGAMEFNAGQITRDVVMLAVPYASSPLPVIDLSVTPDAISAGGSATLSWNSENATVCSIDNGIGDVPLSGAMLVFPEVATTYTITATGTDGSTATDSVTVTVTFPLTLQITSPADGEVIDRPDVMVQGTFTNTPGVETGITVNGVLALVYEDQFVANHVPLQEGDNTLTVTATDTDGNTWSTSIDVTAIADTGYIRVRAHPESGVSPLETRLLIDGSFSIDESSISGSGAGTVDFLESSAEEYAINMTGLGLYYFTAEVEKDGAFYTNTVAVLVVNQSQLDAKLQSVFAGLKTALAVGDIEMAASAFTTRSRERYRDAFEDISESLPQVATDMQEIELIYVHEDVAKYRIHRLDEIDGEMIDITYYLYFVVDTDGIWRLDQF